MSATTPHANQQSPPGTWTLAHIARACSARLILPQHATAAPEHAIGLVGASIDSRAIIPGGTFIALRGQHADGHDFTHAAADAGAALLIVERESSLAGLSVPALLVADARAALEALARHYRAQPGFPRVVAVTGSNGKTSTVRLIDSVLAAGALRGTRPAKSFNNALGVPITILNARLGDDYLVCEIGTSTPGEIPARTALARPDIAVITSIGRAHVEGLGSLAGIAHEKTGLVWFAAPGAVAIVPHAIPELDAALTGVEHTGLSRLLRVGESDRPDPAAASVSNIRTNDEGHTEFTVHPPSDTPHAHPAHFRVPMPGTHAALNAAKAALVARLFGLDDAAIARGLRDARPEPGRAVLERQPWPGGTIDLLDDSYNANPDSMRAGLAVLAARPPASRRVAVVGDMLELGPAADAAHAEVLTAALAAVGTSGLVLAVGPRMRAAAAEARTNDPQLRTALDAAHAAALLPTLLRAGDAVLVKASRSTRLDLVVDAIRAASSPSPATPAPRTEAAAR